nr:DUF2309 domain-containing protein [Oceanococcus sp. HetDA_MAG_MS8]
MTASALHTQIEEALAPVSPFWPMKGYVSHNPLQGLEHLPFDTAFDQGQKLFGARGYLPTQEYRELYSAGRIQATSLERAMIRLAPKLEGSIQAGKRLIHSAEVLQATVVHGIRPLEPKLLDWEFASGRAYQAGPQQPQREDLRELWQAVLSSLKLDDPQTHPEAATNTTDVAVELPQHQLLSDWLDQLCSSSVVADIDAQVIKWLSAFVDEGMASWEMPAKAGGFFAAWKALAQYDSSAALMGIKGSQSKIAQLPDDPHQAILQAFKQLQIPASRWLEYLSRAFAQLPGWTGLVRWRGLNPEDPIQNAYPIDPVQYLAVRMFYEVELVAVAARRHLGCAGTLAEISAAIQSRGLARSQIPGPNTAQVCAQAWRLFQLAQCLDLSPATIRALNQAEAETLLGWMDAFPEEQHQAVWLEAYEDSYRCGLLRKIAEKKASTPEVEGRPLAQAAFCIDVRSEPFRRHFEATGQVQTFGYAGFFGIPISHRGYDTEESLPLCPVLLTPGQASVELPRGGQEDALQDYAAGTRWRELGQHLFHDLKHNPIAAFLLVDVLGLLFSLGLLGKTLFGGAFAGLQSALSGFFAPTVATQIDPSEQAQSQPVGGRPITLPQGFSIAQQADFVAGGLRTIGLIENFGRFVVLCGHGSTTDNNPYSAALDCGACGGRHGDPNARAFAAMGNNPEVRQALAERGLQIPQDTWFLAAKHNTTTDRVEFYDLCELPASHQPDLHKLEQQLAQGGRQQAWERVQRIPDSPKGLNAEQAWEHVKTRSADWASTRPEWGLSGNAAFIIGRRALTQGIDLEGRCFLHSYDPAIDPQGEILEKIMTAPLVVGEWINMQYYTSATDPWKYGSGSKVIHNIVAGIGVMYGAQSDLATGLPLQTVNDGPEHFHEPMRLLALIEASPDIITGIIAKHAVLQQFFHNGWVNLVAVDSSNWTFQRYNTAGEWEAITL